jgi:hypothetical protein
LPGIYVSPQFLILSLLSFAVFGKAGRTSQGPSSPGKQGNTIKSWVLTYLVP